MSLESSNIERKRNKILAHLKRVRIDPLVFVRGFGKNIIKLRCRRIDSLVLEAIKNARVYYSFNTETRRIETDSGRLRSSIDIWRHIQSQHPEIDIFTVMETLYTLRYRIYGHYCTTVERAVFRFPKAGNSWEIYHTINDQNFGSEFDVDFSCWERLH